MTVINRLRILTLLTLFIGGTGVIAAPSVSIAVTKFGIPHISAVDYRGLGYGLGYAMAQNDVCGMGAAFATYSGERALRFGDGNTDINYILGRRPIDNAVSDFAVRLMFDQDIRRAQRALSPKIRDLISGYALGFNHYLALNTLSLPEPCRTTGLVRFITPEDIQRRVAGFGMLLSSGLLLRELYDAEPPSDKLALAEPPTAADNADLSMAMAGSNGYAFGRDTTDSGRGLLLGNPHFFWDGPNRFIEVHLTIPGEYDAMGVTVQGIPLVLLGFNRSLAWTHTVSTDLRGAIYRLTLDPVNPTRYIVDGRSVPMTHRRIVIRIRSSTGAIATRTHDFWITSFGPVLAGASLPWTRQFAYALGDANQDNNRMLQQWLDIGRSPDVSSLKTALARDLGIPWMNTIAADRDGDAFYGDLSVTPDFDAVRLRDCSVAVATVMARFLALLDGSQSRCHLDWQRLTPSGVLPAAARPWMIRTDFVANSNGSHWLSNASSPLEGFSPVIGPERIAQSLRTRQGQIQVSDRLAGKDGLPGNRMSQTTLEQILFSNRSLQADMIMDDLLSACRQVKRGTGDTEFPARVLRGCTALSQWNRRYELDSIAAHLFTEFVNQLKAPGGEDLGTTPEVWRVPFDPVDAVHTPRELNTDNPAILQALSRAVERLDKARIPLDARLADIQFVTRNGLRIPLPGGATYSALHATLIPTIGYSEPLAPSNSYIQVVTFDASGPVADAILAGSQSPSPGSPFNSDQTWAYSRKQWVPLPFTPQQIEAASTASPTILDLPGRVR
jgi:acyl-homoserine-lactone acylase